MEVESTGPSGSGEAGETVADTSLVTRDYVPDDSTASIDHMPIGPVPLPEPNRDRDFPSSVGRYRLDRRIGIGGMGEVIRGRDVEIGCEIALKVILKKHQDSAEMCLRFVEEAQVCGQLVHPSIVPVYGIGSFPDGRPFFVMKLVKGETLSKLLESRSDPAEDLLRYLSIFDQICQAIAYAHSRSVIHRDLKPLNVMVGAFGEVQTMDWGMAKLLTRESDPEAESEIHTVRDGTATSEYGDVKGTIRYMPPEQARGQIDLLDQRTDVFALGAILCEILTGHPPYLGRSSEVRAKAVRADLADALSRLDACGADIELQSLARVCLSPDRDDRPRDAGQVAAHVAAYVEGVQERLRQAELERVEAETRAEGETKRRVLADELAGEADRRATSERKRRRLQAGLAAALLSLAALGGLGAAYYQKYRSARIVSIARVIGVASTLLEVAKADPENLSRWQTALAAAQQAEGVASGDPVASRQIAKLLGEVQAGLDAAERDKVLLDRIVDIRSARADDLDGTVTDSAYAEAFREASLDLATLLPAEAGAKIKARPAEVAVTIAAALDDWSLVRRNVRKDRGGAGRLTEVARLADPDSWRNELRTTLASSATGRQEALNALAEKAKFSELGATSLTLLGASLKDLAVAETVLRRAQLSYPNDVWINCNLANVLEHRSRRDEAVRFYTAARALRPETAHDLAHLLVAKGESDEGIDVFRALVRVRPENAHHLCCFGATLKSWGRSDEAASVLDLAVTACRDKIRLKPGSASSYSLLAIALSAQGKFDEAIAEFRTAIRLKPDYAEAYANLGNALRAQGKIDEAIAEYRTAIRLKPDFAAAYNNLGVVLSAQRKFDEAIAECRTAIRLKPDFAKAYVNLGIALSAQGKIDEAIAECRTAIRLKPDFAEAYVNLGHALSAQGKIDEAIAEYRTAIRLKPDFAAAYNSLGIALKAQGKIDEAIAECRTAIRLKPDDADAYNNLGVELSDQGKFDEAVAEYRTAIRLKPDFAKAYSNLGIALKAQGKIDEAIVEFQEAIRSKPDYMLSYFHLGVALNAMGKAALAESELREFLKADPNSPAGHRELARSLKDQGKIDAAISEYRAALRLETKKLATQNLQVELGRMLIQVGRIDEAIDAFRIVGRVDRRFDPTRELLEVATTDPRRSFDALWKQFRGPETLANPPQEILNMADLAEKGARWADARMYLSALCESTPNDGKLWSRKGFAALQLHLWETAVEELGRAIELGAGWEDRERRAWCLGELGRWGEAVDAYAECVRIVPDVVFLWGNLSHAQLAAGKLDDFRKTCEAMMERFRGADPRTIRGVLLFSCVWAPDGTIDYPRLLKLANIDESTDIAPRIRSAVLYRLGRFDEATKMLIESNKGYQHRGWDLSFLAMAEYKMGRTNEGRATLQKAIQWVEIADRESGPPDSARWFNAKERIEVKTLLDEARKIVKPM